MNKTDDPLFARALLASTEGQVPVGYGISADVVLAAVRAMQPTVRPETRSYHVPTLWAGYVLEYLRSSNVKDAHLWHEPRQSLLLFTNAPQAIVERAVLSAEKRWQEERREAKASKLQRYSVRCGFCKVRWMEEKTQRQAQASMAFGQTHHCPNTDFVRQEAAKTADSKLGRGDRRTREQLIDDELSLYTRFLVEPVKWKVKGTMTECGPRCMSATGPNCDCRCRGKNHGGNRVL